MGKETNKARPKGSNEDMQEKLLKFTSIGQSMPEKRPAPVRRRDFGEIYNPFAATEAIAQASRCSQCGTPFCQVHCPLHNAIPDWLKFVAEERLEEAYELAIATNPFPDICGRICPQDRLCEGSCVIEQSGHGAVTIGQIERYIADTAWEKGWIKPINPAMERSQSIGIVGSGPAGLAAATFLRKRGYKVAVYDRHDRMGGLMIYGIPNFKLDKSIIVKRVASLSQSGVAFFANFELGRDATLSDLRQRHDAILLAFGVYKAKQWQGRGHDLKGVIPALSYLTTSDRVALGDSLPDRDKIAFNAKDRRVVVIGGGDTAMDCVRTAKRQGAKSVQCLYRRDRHNMPGSRREVLHAEEEGVEFLWQSQPETYIGDSDGKVLGIRAHRMHLGLPDASGRQKPEPIQNSHFDLEADLVIEALGFDPEDAHRTTGESELALSEAGTVETDERSLMTNLPGVFAAGDLTRGASLVVWAVRDGREAAASIDRYLKAALLRQSAAE